MFTPRIRSALVILAASAGLAGCTNLGPYGGIGVGVGSGYGGYGYDPYYAGYGYGSGYGYNPYGWYNGFYYPGTGYWVYDPDRNRRELTPEERAYWNERIRERMLAKRGVTGTTSTAAAKENWSGFNRRDQASAPVAASGNAGGQADQRSIRQISEARRQAQAERQQARSERQESVRQQVLERRESRRASKPTDD